MGVDIDKIFRFADLVNADPWAIQFAVEMGERRLRALLHGQQGDVGPDGRHARFFNAKSGQDLARLDTRSVLIVFAKAFRDLSDRVREYDADLEQWMFDEAFDGEALWRYLGRVAACGLAAACLRSGRVDLDLIHGLQARLHAELLTSAKRHAARRSDGRCRG